MTSDTLRDAYADVLALITATFDHDTEGGMAIIRAQDDGGYALAIAAVGLVVVTVAAEGHDVREWVTERQKAHAEAR